MRKQPYLPVILLGIVAIAVLLALAIITAPLFHWLWFGVFYLHPIGSILTLAVAAVALLLLVSRGRRVGIRGWLLLAVLLFGLILYARLASGFSQRAFVADMQPTMLDQLPETTQVRFLPMSVAERFGDNRVQDPLYHLGDFDPLDTGAELNWVAPRVPTGEWNKLTGRNDGFVVVRNDGSVETVEQPMMYGENMRLGKNIVWQLLRRRYWVDYTEIYYIRSGNEIIGIVPYLGYRFIFPVRVPYWAGVSVFHGDGRIEDLTPEAAQTDPRLVGQRLYPEALARAVAKAWAYRNGIANAWFTHADQVEIPELVDSANQMPFLLPAENGPVWFVAAEPYGPAYGIYKMFWFDAHSGALSLFELPANSSLIGPNRVTGYVRSAFPNYNWYVADDDRSSGSMVAIEPRPFVMGGKLYWMETVTTVDAAGITHTVLVDAQDASIRYFNTEAEVEAFRAGAFAGRTPTATATQGAAQSLASQSTPQPDEPVRGIDVSALSDRELLDLLRRISDELTRRQP